MTNFLYNPDRKPREQLITEFVVRTELLKDIMDDLETSPMETPEQHYLLVGQRGTGKTTLLNRIKYAVEDSEKLKDWLIPVIFSEEQYNISELANLWESVAHFLEDYHGFTGISTEMEQLITKNNFEELCYEILEKYLKEKDKKIVLLIDNVGDLLKKLGDVEVRRLREILQTKSDIRLIAGSPFYLDNILDYKQPFFEFFKIKRLEGLTKEETEYLLLKLGEVFNEKNTIEKIIKETPDRIETLRVLTGGVPRTISLMFRIFIDHEHESSLKDLERVLDEVTPLYKHRMDDLPAQQQKIVDAVARNWDAISVKELKEKIRLDGKVISAQLGQLQKNQIIDKKETGKKNHLYSLKERFWNIWYLMRYGRNAESQRVIWLVKFLENWCTRDELEKRVLDYMGKVRDGKLDDSSKSFFAEVYKAIKTINTDIKVLLRQSLIAPEDKARDEKVRVEVLEFHRKENWEKVIKTSSELKILLKNDKLIVLQSLLQLRLSTKEDEITNELFNKLSVEKNKRPGKLTINLNSLEIFILISILSVLSMVEAFSKKFDLVSEKITTALDILSQIDDNSDEIEIGLIHELICILLAENQFQIVGKYFENKKYNLKHKMKPTYYAWIYFNKGREDDEFLRAGDELRENLEAIIDKVNAIKSNSYNFTL